MSTMDKPVLALDEFIVTDTHPVAVVRGKSAVYYQQGQRVPKGSAVQLSADQARRYGKYIKKNDAPKTSKE